MEVVMKQAYPALWTDFSAVWLPAAVILRGLHRFRVFPRLRL